MRPNDSRGFTMVELMVIIGIMGIIMLMAVPTMSKYINSSRLVGASDRLMNDLRYARSLSNSQRRTYEFRSTSSGYTVASVSPDSTVLTRTLERGVTFAVPDTARFYAWGLTETTVITLTQQDHSRVVRMNASGQVTHD